MVIREYFTLLLVSAIQHCEWVVSIHVSSPSPASLPCTPFPITPLGHCRTWAELSVLQLLASYVFYTCQCISNSAVSVHPTLLCACVHLSSTSAYLFLPWRSVHLYHFTRFHIYVFPGDSVRKESAFNEGDLDSVPGSGRSPEGFGNPLVFSPGELHGQRSLVCCSPWGDRAGYDLVTSTFTRNSPVFFLFMAELSYSSHPPLSLRPHVFSERLLFYSCPENRLFCSIFLDFIYVIFLIIAVWHSSLSTFTKMTQVRSFLWFTDTPLYTCTTSSLSIGCFYLLAIYCK